MSLKALHLIFVTMFTTMSFGFAVWGFISGHILAGLLGIVMGILIIVYGVYFLKKLKKISYL